MAVYGQDKRKAAGIFANVNGKKTEFSAVYVDGGGGVPKRVYYKDVPAVDIVTWANGTVGQLADMLQAHYDGLINIYDYWKVGDARTVTLTTGAVDTFVLLDKDIKDLEVPIGEHTKGAFVVGERNCLFQGKPSSSKSNATVWGSCAGRSWCNSTFRNYVPEDLRALFKQHHNYGALGKGTTPVKSVDWFAFASIKEVINSVGSKASAAAEAKNVNFAYYKTTANRKKTYGGKASSYCTRSPFTSSSDYICYVNGQGTGILNTTEQSNNTKPYSVFGVI